MVIDAHQHFWRFARGDYWWTDTSVEPHPTDKLPSGLSTWAEAARVTGTVSVQAAPTMDETLFLQDLAERTPLIKGVVRWVDLALDVGGQLDLIAHPGSAKPIRFSGRR